MNKLIITFNILFAVICTNLCFSQQNNDCFYCCDLEDKDIDIRESCNYSDCSTWSCLNHLCIATAPNAYTIILSKPVYRVFQFDAKFTENCKYNEPGTYWQKLMKISTIPDSEERSIRLGWRSDNTSFIEVGLYGHIYYGMHFLSLDYFAPLDSKIENYDLVLSHNGLFARTGNKAYAIKRTIFNKDEWYTTGMSKNAYYEGQNESGAPHDMKIEVSDIWWDCPSTWDQASDKGFYYSIFYSDDPATTVYASNEIAAPVGTEANIDDKYVIIEPNCDIEFIAGNRILLKKGFHAEKLSHFKALIISDKGSVDTMSNLFSVNEENIEYKIVDLEGDTTEYKKNLLNKEVFRDNTFFYKIFPNPHPGIFTIEYNDESISEYTIHVLNMMGKPIYTRQHITPGITIVDISNQSKGIYFVRLQAEDKVYTEKVVYQ